MAKTLILLIFTAAFGLLAGCGGGAANGITNAGTAPTAAEVVLPAPTKEMLLGLETKAFEAWKNGDTTFWEGYFDQSFVAFLDGKRVDKAGEIALITGKKCQVANLALSDESMVPVGNDAAVLTTKVTLDAICGGQKVPSPGISTTLYIRSGDTWKSAYHNEVAIIDPKSAKRTPAKKVTPRPVVPAEPADGGRKMAPTMTDALLAVEKKGWEAWKSRDAAVLGDLFTDEITHVSRLGTLTVGKKAVVARFSEPKCDIQSASPVDATGTQTALFVGILTYRGTATGTCDGQLLTDFWATTIYQKDGAGWKAAFMFENPA